MSTRLPEIHVYGTPQVTRVVWRDHDREVELTNCKVIEVKRVITVGDLPVTEVHFIARIVEHQEDA